MVPMIRILYLPPEKWKLIPDLPFILDGGFEISNHGRVRRVNTGHIVQGGMRGNGEGWKRVSLTVETKVTKEERGHRKAPIVRTSVFPHRMVYRLFGPPIPHNHHLYHINGCRDDNYIWNLATTSKREHRRRVARLKKEGKYYHRRGPI